MELPNEVEKKLRKYAGDKIVEDYKAELNSQWVRNCDSLSDEEIHDILLSKFIKHEDEEDIYR